MAAKTKPADAAAAAPAEPKQCACGCGETVPRVFKQGHDQKLVAKLASDLVHQDVWRGTCMGILKLKDVKNDLQVKIDTVSGYVSEKLSEALGRKVFNAAMRAWELEKTRDQRAAAKAVKKAEAAEKKAARKPRPTKATATNADVDAAEAEMDAQSEEASGVALGSTVRVKVGKRERNAVVHGMNQAGKVTAIRYKVGNNEITKTEGQFEVVPTA